MTCRKVRQLMPLAAGGDLRPGAAAAAFEAHIDHCPGCRTELERFRAGLAAVRAAAKAAGVQDWTEAEWRAAMARATAADAVRTPAGARLRPRWAAASALGALIGLVVLSVLFRGTEEVRRLDGRRPVVASAPAPQDRIAVTMVSPETGLQIVWFLDKNFDYEGERD